MRRMYSLNQLQEISLKKIESTTSLKVFENIVDKDGNKRFIEGNISLTEVSGVTKTYGKWSLSGSHLLLVLCIDIDNTTVLNWTTLCLIDIPTWIMNKIVPLQQQRVDTKVFTAYDSSLQTQNLTGMLSKVSGGLQINANMTASADRSCRIAYDLLIDNE